MEIIRFDSLDSTFEEAGRIMGKLAPGEYLLLTGEQTAGRGQGRNAFASPYGNGVYATLLIVGGFAADDTAVLAQRLTPLAAVCATEYVRSFTGYGDRLTVKWINDLHLDGKKYGGILSACRMVEGVAASVRIGYGINTRNAALPEEIQYRATSLCLPDGGGDSRDNETIAVAIAQSILSRIHNLQSTCLITQYAAMCSTVGRTVLLPDGRYGRACGIGEDFTLSVALPDGMVESLHSTAGAVIV